MPAKMCLYCWKYQPIKRWCLKLKKHVEPLDRACEHFDDTIEYRDEL